METSALPDLAFVIQKIRTMSLLCPNYILCAGSRVESRLILTYLIRVDKENAIYIYKFITVDTLPLALSEYSSTCASHIYLIVTVTFWSSQECFFCVFMKYDKKIRWMLLPGAIQEDRFIKIRLISLIHWMWHCTTSSFTPNSKWLWKKMFWIDSDSQGSQDRITKGTQKKCLL